jgi:hypothetical protein
MKKRKTIFPDHADVRDSSWTFEPVEDAVARRSTRQSVKATGIGFGGKSSTKH